MTADSRTVWESYREAELARIEPRVRALGYALDGDQVHTKGERYLQSGRKLVLTGVRRSDGMRVVIKASTDPSGIAELAREHERRRILHTLDFAYLPFHSPEELHYEQSPDQALAITEFIEQEAPFLRLTLEEQFFLALGAFKEQEGVHATTAAHARTIRAAFGMKEAPTYVQDFAAYSATVERALPGEAALAATLTRATEFLHGHADILDGYAGFLTHTDFVPHNFRVRDGVIYLLDHTSLTFGNKYESWARCTNFMTLYNPELEQALVDYVRLNRSEFEYQSFRLMRVYKLGFLLAYYADSLARTEGDLRTLSEARLAFWRTAADAVLDDTQIASDIVHAYRASRDALRSEEEKERQRALGQL